MLYIAVAHGNFSDIQTPEWENMRVLLASVWREGVQRGFTRSEIASFILCFKKPLFDRLCHQLTQNRDALVEQLWLSTSLLDQLGLWVTEIFLKARKEVIERQQQEMLELSTSVVKLWQGIVASRAGLSTVPPLKYSNPCRSRKFFTAPQPSPRVRGGSKKFTNDLGSL